MSKPEKIPHTRHLFPELGAWLINGQRAILRGRWLLRENHDWFPAWSIGAIAGVCGMMLAVLLFFFDEPQLVAATSTTAESVEVLSLPEPEPTRQPEIQPKLSSDFRPIFPLQEQSLPNLANSQLKRTRLPYFWDQRELGSYESRPKRVQENFVKDNWSRLTPEFAAIEQFRPYLTQGATVPVTPSYITTSAERTPFDGIAGQRQQGVFIEKHASPTTAVGESYSYVIHVMNRTEDAIDEVYVHEKISAIHRVEKVEPPAAIQGDELVWSIGKLPAKGRKAFRVTLSPDAMKSIETETRLKNSTKVGGIARVAEPLPAEPELLPVQPKPVPVPKTPAPEPEPIKVSDKPKPFPNLKLSVTPVKAVRKGETLSLKFKVSNVGTAAAENITLYVRLSGEFKHKYGERVKHTITRLEPGQARTALLQARAKEVGNAQLSASLQLAGDEKRSEDMKIRVESPPKSISQNPEFKPIVECQRPDLDESIVIEEVGGEQIASATVWTKFSE